MSLKDLLFPKLCIGCGYLGAYVCLQCQNKMYEVGRDICLYCNKTSYFGLTHHGCRRKYGIDGCLSLFKYNWLFKRIIKNIKYRLAVDVWKEINTLIKPQILLKTKYFLKSASSPVLQPIPLHVLKLKARGFNQALLISQFFTSVFGVETVNHLTRVKNTEAQAQLKNKKKRNANMIGAFAIQNGVHPALYSYFLVDDVVTTGSTVKEASKELKKNGANTVYVLTLTRG